MSEHVSLRDLIKLFHVQAMRRRLYFELLQAEHFISRNFSCGHEIMLKAEYTYIFYPYN